MPPGGGGDAAEEAAEGACGLSQVAVPSYHSKAQGCSVVPIIIIVIIITIFIRSSSSM